MKCRPTPRAVRQALAIMEAVTAPTPRERAEQRLRTAVAAYRAAEQEALQDAPGAADKAAEAALEELNAARADLAQLGAQS